MPSTFNARSESVAERCNGVRWTRPAIVSAARSTSSIEITRQRLRARRLAKIPGVAETLDWAQALAVLHADHLDAALVQETLGCVLKDADDIKRFQAEAAKSGFSSFLATP